MVTATVVRRYNAKQDKYVLVLFDDWAGWAQNTHHNNVSAIPGGEHIPDPAEIEKTGPDRSLIHPKPRHGLVKISS